MKRNVVLANRIREVLLNGKWIANTNFKEQLLSVNREQANQKVGNLNTIALLTFHVNYYLAGFVKVFNGGNWRSGTNTVLTFRKLSLTAIGINWSVNL
ncbi:MAG TPA: hypothetical protein PKY28_01290 [Ferruginibacter sp.]|mgnify:CR=1 FL=1|nr:hypothetical protein [Ferruginibacter sp.]